MKSEKKAYRSLTARAIFVMYYLVILITLLILLGALFLWLAPVFGGKPDEASLSRIKASNNHNGERFKNLVKTSVSTKTEASGNTFDVLKDILFGAPGKNPDKPIPNEPIDRPVLEPDEMIWLGHSTVLFSTSNTTVLTDPVFYRASPIPLGGKPFEYTAPITPDDLPEIDIVLISHDHYDHLDMRTIKQIKGKVKTFLVPLGIKAHLTRWGVREEKIFEFDWYESREMANIRFVFAPSRHFSGRGLSDRFSTLWGSWIVTSTTLNLYFSGDGGYSSEFKKIGDQFGPFDIALMENGAYDKDWAQIHMFPEETVVAANDLQAKYILPVHWGKYDLARHQWLEPIERLYRAAFDENVSIVAPKIGEKFRIKEPVSNRWWR